MPAKKATAKKAPAKKVATKKAAAKKATTKTSRTKKSTTKSKTNSKRLPADFKPSTKRKSEFDTEILKTAEEIEDYLLSTYSEEQDDIYDLPSPTEMQFCHAYLSNGFKQGPAVRTVLPELSTANSVQRAHDFLSRERVQRYLTRELHSRRLRMGVTADWVCKKYLSWATLDITQFIEFDSGSSRRGSGASVYLKKSINELPPLVRQSIKSLTVDDKGKVKVEFIDQKSALDSLAKMLGFSNDKLTIDSKVVTHLHFDEQDKEA